MTEKGVVKKWLSRGFGFIEMEDERGDVFCHFSNLEDGRKHLKIGENVTFDLEDDERSGKQRAARVIGDGTGEEPDLTPRDDFGGDRRGGGRDRGYGGGYGGGRGGGRDRDYGGRSGGGRDGGRGGGRNSGSCYKFKEGNCSYGDSCRFSHDSN